MSNRSDLTRDGFMLKKTLAETGHDWWWHSFTGRDAMTGEERAFFIEFFTCNPALGESKPVFGQLSGKNGEKKHNRLWNGGTGTGTVSLYRRHNKEWSRIDTIDADHIGCEYGEYGTPGEDFAESMGESNEQ